MTLYGFNAFIRAGEESTYGTSQTTDISDIRLNSSSLISDQEKNRKTNLSVPSSGMLASVYDGFKNSGGSFEIPLQYQGSGMFLKMALGNVATTTAGSDQVHTYTPIFDLPSATIQFQRGSNMTNSSEKFLGCKVASMTISCEAGGEMVAGFDIIARDSTARAAKLSAASFVAGDSILHFESGNLTGGGTLLASSVEIRSFELTLDNKLERKNVLGSKKTSEPVISDVREVTMSITADLDDNNVYNDMLNGNSGTVQIKFTRTALTDHYFEINLNNAIIEGYSDAVTAFGRVERTYTIRGLASSTDPGLSIVIRNDESSPISLNP